MVAGCLCHNPFGILFLAVFSRTMGGSVPLHAKAQNLVFGPPMAAHIVLEVVPPETGRAPATSRKPSKSMFFVLFQFFFGLSRDDGLVPLHEKCRISVCSQPVPYLSDSGRAVSRWVPPPGQSQVPHLKTLKEHVFQCFFSLFRDDGRIPFC